MQKQDTGIIATRMYNKFSPVCWIINLDSLFEIGVQPKDVLYRRNPVPYFTEFYYFSCTSPNSLDTLMLVKFLYENKSMT